VVKRAKAAMMERKAKEMAPAVVRRDRYEKRSKTVVEDKQELGAEVKLSNVSDSTRSDGAGFGLGGFRKSWSLQDDIQGQRKDRGVSPPPLPVPIASFIT
jgi:hypothetical protein